MKKKMKWLIAALCALVLVGGGVLAAVLWTGGEAAPKTPEYSGKLYWNVEREFHKSGEFLHQQVEEGVYRVLVAVDGKQEKLDFLGIDLVNKFDTLEVAGLVLNEDGYVTQVLNVEECTGGYAAKQYYVERVDGDQVVANMNPYFIGYSKTLQITDQTQVYDVSDSGPLCGLPSKIQFNDQIYAIEDRQGNITHVYTIPYKAPGAFYWNVDKPYDSVNKISTRQPNEFMQYEMDFILDGQLVTYKCRDVDVVNKIDGSRVCGLEFDEEGYIIAYQSVATATNGGRLGATNYYVESLLYKGHLYGFRKSSAQDPKAARGSFFPSEDVKVYDMTGIENPKGTLTDLRVNDRIICVLDGRTMIHAIYVVARAADSPMYWNVDRDWNKTTKSTNRRPDANGYYHFKMAVNGQQITVKTNDKNIANQIESPVNVGLKLNGNVVEKVYTSSMVYPAGVFGSWYKITKIDADGTITAEKTSNGVTTTKTGKVAADCQFYNVSSTAAVEGEKISFSHLKVGDVIHSYKNFNNEIAIVYLVTSKSNSPIYWNVDKNLYWDSSNKVSTREKQEDGYYHILLAVNGKQVVYKTRDKKLVDDMDNRSCMALSVSGTVITKVISAAGTINTQGGLFASSWYVTAINGNKITATNSKGESETRTMASGCQVYDVSPVADMVGQKTTVKVGDQIRGLMNDGKRITVLYVLNTAKHLSVHTCAHCGQEVNWRAWDGTVAMENGGHYILNSDVVSTKGPDLAEGEEATLCLNGFTLRRDAARVFGDIKGTLNVIDCMGTGCVHGGSNNNASVAMVTGGTLNIYGGTFTAEEVTAAGKNGGVFAIINGGAINLYNGTISGGKTTGYGGNINVSSGSFTMYDGLVTGGTSGEGQYGGNIALSSESAVAVIHGGVISAGTAGSHGGNISAAKDGAILTINGGSITGGTAATYGANISTANASVVEIYDAQITEGEVMLRNTAGITLGGKLNISQLHLHNTAFTLSAQKPLAADSQILVSATVPGVLCEAVEAQLAGCFQAFSQDCPISYADGKLMAGAAAHTHCDCGGVLDHTCDDTIEWIALTEDTVMEDGGHYFLPADMDCRPSYASNATVYLCLNGHELTFNARVFADIPEGTTLNLYDCGTTGSVRGQTRTNNASIAMVRGVLNIYGGTYTAGVIETAGKNGGIFTALGNGVINLYDGTITGGNTTGLGGCVYITQDAKLNMYGGSITDGTSGTSGGTLAVAGNAVFTMTGGTISGGETAETGNCVNLASTQPMILGGAAQIQEVFVTGENAIVLSEEVALDETQAQIGLNGTVAGVLISDITEAQAARFSFLGNGQMSWNANKLVVALFHAHCVCINAEAVPADHECTANQVWQAVSVPSVSYVTLDSGYYFLDWKGVNNAKSIRVEKDATVHLCLNGSMLRAQSLVTLGDNAKLIICDCSAEQTGWLDSSKNAPLQIKAGQEVTLYSGNISGSNHYNNKLVQNAATVTMEGGSFFMYGGKLYDGYNKTGNGGNLVLDGNAEFYMYGGQIVNGESVTGNGGNVYVGTATAVIIGGKIGAGTAAGVGNCIYVSAEGTITVDPAAQVDEVIQE